MTQERKLGFIILFLKHPALSGCAHICIASEASEREASRHKVRGKFLKSTDGSDTALLARSADFGK